MSAFETLGRESLGPALVEFLGEPATVTNPGSAAATINLIVEREPLELVQMAPGGLSPRLEWSVKVLINKADLPSFVLRGTTVAIPRRVGDATSTTFKVTTILSQDGGMWSLGLGLA